MSCSPALSSTHNFNASHMLKDAFVYPLTRLLELTENVFTKGQSPKNHDIISKSYRVAMIVVEKLSASATPSPSPSRN